MALFSQKSWDDWLTEYSESHQNHINRQCHAFGIPMIILSILILPLGLFFLVALQVAIFLFVLGWVLQFVGHLFEGKLPEFFRDWRFLFVGSRWWVRKTFGGS